MVLTALDFQQARVKQILFKSRLRSVLYGVRAAEPTLFQLAENPLNQWITTYLKPAFGGRPEVAEMEHLLRQTLEVGQALVRQHARGEMEQARQGLEQVERLASEIDRRLTSLEHEA